MSSDQPAGPSDAAPDRPGSDGSAGSVAADDGRPMTMDGVEAPLTDKQVGSDHADDGDEPDSLADSGEEPDVLARVTAERDQYRDVAQRVQADFENYRKRIAAQHADEVGRATGRLAEALLPVLDACEAAFVQHPAEVEPLFNLLLGELKKQGLAAIHLHEQPFDPTVADAVLHEPGDEGEPVVSEVLRTGYTWKGKVLRPAMVKVRG